MKKKARDFCFNILFFFFKLCRNRWKEINDLEIKKEEIMQKKTSEDTVKGQSDDEDVEDEDLEDFMDWRSKTLKWSSYCLRKRFENHRKNTRFLYQKGKVWNLNFLLKFKEKSLSFCVFYKFYTSGYSFQVRLIHVQIKFLCIFHQFVPEKEKRRPLYDFL